MLIEEETIVDSLEPAWAVAGEANQVITVVGRHFKNAHGLSCRMGVDTSVAAEYVSSSLVTCIAPVRGAGTVRVGVSNNGVDAGPSSKQLIFEAGRGISSVMPSKAPAPGGTLVTVSVYGRVQGEVGRASCHFGTSVVEGEVRGYSTIVCVAPKTDKEGTVEFRVSEGPSGALLAGSLVFEHLAQLRIASVRPSVGTVGRPVSVSVMVLGGVTGAGGLQCRFGEEIVMGGGVRVVTSSHIVCIAPVSKEAAGVTLDVSANDGADFTSSGLEFVFEAAATVERMIPSRGKSSASGQVVTVVGQHFAQTGG